MPRTIADLSFSQPLSDPLISPDGRWIVYIRGGAHGSFLQLMAIDGTVDRPLSSRRLSSGYFGFSPGLTFSPDSASLLFITRDSQLIEVGIEDGEERRVFAGSELSDVAVCPTGAHIAVVERMAEIVLLKRAHGDIERRINQPSDQGDFDAQFDFVASPTFVSCQHLVFTGWNPPDMPWTGSVLAGVDTALDGPVRRIVSQEGASFTQPKVDSTGRWLHVLADVGGDVAPYRIALPLRHDTSQPPLRRVVADSEHLVCGEPDLGPGQRSYAAAGERLVVARSIAGFGELALIEGIGGGPVTLKRGVFGSISISGDTVVGLRAGARLSPSIFTLNLSNGRFTVLRSSNVQGVPSRNEVEPEVVRFRSSSSQERLALCFGGDEAVPEMDLVARLFRTREVEKGTVLSIHGGPTGQSRVVFSPKQSLLLSMGFNVLHVDYRGSSGHGRSYIEALDGLYGVADISDVVDGARHVLNAGLVGPVPFIAWGASSAGLTAIGAHLLDPDLIKGAVAAAPVTDIAALAAATHRFEKHYFESLVGDPIDQKDRYRRRSPINWDLTGARLLVLQGLQDTVVPPELTRAFVEAKSSQAEISYVEFETEGHSWSDPRSIEIELNEAGAFIETTLAVVDPHRNGCSQVSYSTSCERAE